MILVGQMDSPFVRRVAVSMNLYAMPFERNVISVYADAEAVLYALRMNRELRAEREGKELLEAHDDRDQDG